MHGKRQRLRPSGMTAGDRDATATRYGQLTPPPGFHLRNCQGSAGVGFAPARRVSLTRSFLCGVEAVVGSIQVHAASAAKFGRQFSDMLRVVRIEPKDAAGIIAPVAVGVFDGELGFAQPTACRSAPPRWSSVRRCSWWWATAFLIIAANRCCDR